MKKRIFPIFLAVVSVLIYTKQIPGAEINFTLHDIAKSYHHDPADIRSSDMDGDGDIDIVNGASYFGNGVLSWWE